MQAYLTGLQFVLDMMSCHCIQHCGLNNGKRLPTLHCRQKATFHSYYYTQSLQVVFTAATASL